jgi:hypothetical protein
VESEWYSAQCMQPCVECYEVTCDVVWSVVGMFVCRWFRTASSCG